MTPAGPPPRPLGARDLDPLILLGGLGLVAALAAGLSWGGVARATVEYVTAGVFVAFVLAAVGLSARNGLVLLFLLPPFFNAEDSRPYMFLLEVVVYLTIVAGFVHHLRADRRLTVPYAPLLSLLLVSTAMSFPLNAKEFGLELGISGWTDVLDGLRGADVRSSFFYVRTVLDMASGIALYALVVNLAWTRRQLVRLAMAVVLVYAAVAVTGWLWLRFFPPRYFLSLYLHGQLYDVFSGTGYNTSYFAQYALAYLPVVALLLVERAPLWSRALAAALVGVAGYLVLLTYQRGAWAVLGLEWALLALALRRAARWPVPARAAAVGVLAGLALLLAALLLFTPVGSHAQARALALWQTGDPYREHVLAVAWRMFLDQPFLGVGSGRYGRMFEDYSWKSAADFQWGSLSAHNLYAQFLAEQGALGLLTFLAVLGAVIVPVLRRQSALGEERPAVLFLLVSLSAWLVYGLLQYTFLLRAMEIYFWITLGLVAALGGIGGPPRRVPRRLAVIVVGVLVVLLGLRVATAARRPAVEAGVHALEGGEVRWTRGEAVLVLPVEGPVLRFLVSCPLREVAARPQTVTLLLDDRPVQQLRLDTPAWRLVEVRVEKPAGQTVRLGVRTGYTFVPAALGVNEDDRRLGVLLGPISWPR